MIWRGRMVRAAEDGGTGGAGGAGAATGAGAGAGTGADAGAASGAAGDAGGLFGLADADAPPGKDANGKPVRPDYVAEQFWDGEKGEIRVAELAKSQRDLRAQISRGEHKPPETAEAYIVPKLEGVPDGLVGGETDKLWPEMRTALHAAGVTQKQFDQIAAPFLRAAAAAAQGQAGPNPDAQRATYDAEVAKLGPNGSAFLRDVGAWMKGMENKGILTAAEHQALRGISNADGVRALAKLREMGGERGIPVEALGSDATTQADAIKLMDAGYAKNDQAMIDKARGQLADLEKRGLLRT